MSDGDCHRQTIGGNDLDRENRRRRYNSDSWERRCERIRMLTVPVAELRLISLVECGLVPIGDLEVVVVMVTMIVVVLVVMEVLSVLVDVRRLSARVHMVVDRGSRQRVCCQEEREGSNPKALSRKLEESHASGKTKHDHRRSEPEKENGPGTGPGSIRIASCRP